MPFRTSWLPGRSAGASGPEDTPWAGGATVHWRQQQQGMLRFNCADSLDRTNAASYFVAVQASLHSDHLAGLMAVHCVMILHPLTATPMMRTYLICRHSWSSVGNWTLLWKVAIAQHSSHACNTELNPAAIPHRSLSFCQRCVQRRSLYRHTAILGHTTASVAFLLSFRHWTCLQGWEERRDPNTGSCFYIDHNSRQTFWEVSQHGSC
jgi:WW domain